MAEEKTCIKCGAIIEEDKECSCEKGTCASCCSCEENCNQCDCKKEE